MLVHPLFIMATGQDVAFGHIEPDSSASIMLAALIAGFVYVALAIDRRSLLVPTLAYFGTLGIYYLVNSAANTTGIPPFALILLVVGALIITFGAGWQHIRRLIVRPTLPAFILDRLPPIKA
jgi:peptidoglycan/LPS O-acetylase OafA/YrhL